MLPDVWVPVTVATPPQLSVAVGITQVATAVQFAPADRVWWAGQVMVGAWLSVTVTVNEQVAVLPLLSVAV